MECFVIFVMAWCWCNATESKPQNVSSKHIAESRIMNIFKLFIENFQESLLYSVIKDFLFPLFLALISAITAYYLFFRQILNEKQKELVLKNEELKNKLTYFTLTIHHAIQNAKEQNENVQGLISQLQKIEIDSHSLIIAPLTDLKNIVEKIDVENYLLSFLKYYSDGNKIENAGKFKIIVDSCGMINHIFIQNDKFLEDKLKLEVEGKMKLSEQVQECAGLMGKCLQKMKEDKNPLFTEMIKIHVDCNQKLSSFGNDFLRGQYYLFLKPCLNLLDNWNEKHIEFDENLGELWIGAKGGVELYNYLTVNNKILINHLNRNFNSVNELINDIEKASIELRKDFL